MARQRVEKNISYDASYSVVPHQFNYFRGQGEPLQESIKRCITDEYFQIIKYALYNFDERDSLKQFTS